MYIQKPIKVSRSDLMGHETHLSEPCLFPLPGAPSRWFLSSQLQPVFFPVLAGALFRALRISRGAQPVAPSLEPQPVFLSSRARLPNFPALFAFFLAAWFFCHIGQLFFGHALRHLLNFAAGMFVLPTLVGQGSAHQPPLFFTFRRHKVTIYFPSLIPNPGPNEQMHAAFCLIALFFARRFGGCQRFWSDNFLSNSCISGQILLLLSKYYDTWRTTSKQQRRLGKVGAKTSAKFRSPASKGR